MTSIYIPRISSNYNEERVKAVFARLNIGVVSRVDFAPLVATPGQTPTQSSFMKAFVHVSMFYDTEIANAIQQAHANNTQYRVYPDVVNARIYWIMVKNHKPIAETTLNLHQVVENHRILENIVMELYNRLSVAETTIQSQADKISTLEESQYDDMPRLMPQLIRNGSTYYGVSSGILSRNTSTDYECDA